MNSHQLIKELLKTSAVKEPTEVVLELNETEKKDDHKTVVQKTNVTHLFNPDSKGEKVVITVIPEEKVTTYHEAVDVKDFTM